MIIKDPEAVHDFYDGVIEGKNVKCYQKLFEQISGIYQDSSGAAPDTLMYTVYSYENTEARVTGELLWGLTVMEPVLVSGECNMTRGHFHLNRSCAEFYFGLSGNGLLLLMDENGSCRSERVFKGSVHHISGSMAHRLVNTGNEQLKVGACWSPAAGHDYDAIKKTGFPYRIFCENGKIICKELNK